MPTGSAWPHLRVRQARQVVDRVRAEPALQQFGRTVAVLNLLPKLSRPLFGAMLKSVDLNASNVPGPPFRLYCAGAAIQAMFPATPLAGAAISVSLLSYDGAAHLTINTDRAAVPDVDQLVACIEASFAELLAAVPTAAALEPR
jgi:diacylglycerol O-acyltransferase